VRRLMNTTVLQSTLDSRALGTELDGLLAARWRPARCTQLVCEPVDLPVVLEQYTQRLGSGELWRAYTDLIRVWFVIARAVDVLLKDPPTVALEVRFFDSDGKACAAGIWARHGDCDWTLHDVLDVSSETRTVWAPLTLGRQSGCCRVIEKSTSGGLEGETMQSG
jgi:hypothetical protein